jgi:hypothetical protein
MGGNARGTGGKCAAEFAAGGPARKILPREVEGEAQQTQLVDCDGRPARNLKRLIRATGLLAVVRTCTMSQIQGTSSAATAIQWQYLQSLQQTNTNPLLQPSASDPMSFSLDPFSGPSAQANGSPSPPLSLGAMTAVIAAQEQSGATGLSPRQQDVFGKLDADGDGKVTSAELQSAFGADNTDIANYVMGKLDTDGDGAISQSEFAAGTTRGMGHHHHHMHAAPSGGSQSGQGSQSTQDPLSALLSPPAAGASSQTTDNSDGSATTTITYADGSKVSMTTAANASSAPDSAPAATGTPQQTQQNLLQQLIKLQAQLTQNFQATTPLVTI